MQVDTKKLGDCKSHILPNGAYALTDKSGKMLAYCRYPEKAIDAKGNSINKWDFIVPDCRK